jgi:K+-transporting ATPase KdpF subunit
MSIVDIVLLALVLGLGLFLTVALLHPERF